MKTHDQEMLERRVNSEVRISHFLAEQVANAATYFGYPEVPENHDLAILGVSSIAKLHLNNAGDPWIHGNAKMHTKNFEVEVLDKVADLYKIKDNYWGYITSGGTEGNLYGLYMSREFYSRRDLPCVYIYSRSSHYSIPKNGHLLGIESLVIDEKASGEMNYDHFRNELTKIKASGGDFPGLIVNLNIGTTMKGAIDDLERINSILDELAIDRSKVLIHADAALNGLIYPFTEGALDLFALGVTSLSVSGHKFLGAIHPCGIVLAKKSIHSESFTDQWVSYVGSHDTTISGSRNGFLALNLWYLLDVKGIEGYKEEALRCIENAKYLKEKLEAIGYPDVGLFPNQTIVTFKKPEQQIVEKYQLATDGDLAHVVVMQHITKFRIDKFIDDLAATI